MSNWGYICKSSCKNSSHCARKVRLALDLIRVKSWRSTILKFTPAAPIVEKVLMSAIVNADHNYDLDLKLIRE